MRSRVQNWHRQLREFLTVRAVSRFAFGSNWEWCQGWNLIEKNWLQYQFKKPLEFWLEISYTRKCSKLSTGWHIKLSQTFVLMSTGGLAQPDVSPQFPNGTSSGFSSQNPCQIFLDWIGPQNLGITRDWGRKLRTGITERESFSRGTLADRGTRGWSVSVIWPTVFSAIPKGPKILPPTNGITSALRFLQKQGWSVLYW